MEIWVFTIFFFLIVLPLVIGINYPVYKNHRKVTGDITNYDFAMRKFVYKVNLTSEEIIRLLETKSMLDELSCKFNDDHSIIILLEYGTSRKYYFCIQECNGFSIVRLEQAAWIGGQSRISYKLNPFMVRKLQAQLIPFYLYGV